jgi:Domain of unknown function (DUF5134)
MVGVPNWLYYLFGVMMLAVAAYDFVLLATSGATQRQAGRDVEISHVAMGTAMAGMFVPAWAFGPNWLWELAFVGLLVWFVTRAFKSIELYGLHVPHTAIHAVMSFAMLLMYWFPMGSLSRRGMSMSMAAGNATMDPALAFVVGFVLFGSAIFTVASPNRGASHFGTHGGRGAVEPVQVAPADGHRTQSVTRTTQASGTLRAIATPSLVDASHVVMCVGMGVMLIFMI